MNVFHDTIIINMSYIFLRMVDLHVHGGMRWDGMGSVYMYLYALYYKSRHSPFENILRTNEQLLQKPGSKDRIN